MRGHHLRQGFLIGNGYYTFGYDYRWENGRSIRTDRLFHRIAYRCVRRIEQSLHAKDSDYQRCSNPEISARILESAVFATIEEIMFNPGRLKRWLEYAKRKSDVSHDRISKTLRAIELKLKKIAQEKRKVLERYATGKLNRKQYAAECVAWDNEVDRVKIERSELLKKIPLIHKAEASMQACSNSALRRERDSKNAPISITSENL